MTNEIPEEMKEWIKNEYEFDKILMEDWNAEIIKIKYGHESKYNLEYAKQRWYKFMGKCTLLEELMEEFKI